MTSLQYIQNWVLVYCWLQVLLLSVHSIQTDTISTRAVLLIQNKGITDTLMASSAPLVGKVTADTLIASSVPLVGRAIVTDSLSKSPVRGLEGTLLTSLSLSVCSSDPVVLVTKQHWYFPGYLDITLSLSAWFKNVALPVAKVRLTCERNAHYAHTQGA